MQKFVKLKNKISNVEKQECPHPSQVKLVGYLKKKRTKVGGWRKMWFVLQNQLLLSYPSKEDYDRKLISFKDVLNLVPGTIVRPLGGYRFAIQTTSESVYIFRCDDNKTYMEWITALVDSLSIGSSAAKKKEITGGAKVKKPLSGSHSCSSLVRSKKTKSVHIPIAHGTARILNRTGLSDSDLREFSSNGCLLHDAEKCERANYFCLHDNQLLLGNQSNAVSRINRMFSGSASDADLSAGICGTTGGLSQQSGTLAKSMRSKELLCESDGECSARSALSRKMHGLLMLMGSEHLEIIADSDVEKCGTLRDINSNTRFEIEDCLRTSAEDCDADLHANGTGTAAEGTGLEDQIQRLSLRGSSRYAASDKSTKPAGQEVSYLRLSSTIRTEESPFSRRRRRPEQGASSTSSAGSYTSSERRNESSYNGDGSEISEETRRNQPDEPIYAVVDLKNKYEHRAKMRHEMEARRRSQIGYLKSLDEVATDYEEVLSYPSEPLQNVTTYPYDDENIYEPINIPESSYTNHKHRNILWKYISRINLDAFIEMTRSRKKNNNKSNEHISPFANIKQKFGHHRKSMRIRMIKLYTRDHPPEDIDDSTDASDNKSDRV